MTRQTIDAIPKVETQELFSSVNVCSGTFVPVPGWQSVLKAIDPVAYLCPSDRFPKSITGKVRDFLVILDRGSHEWNVNSYFIVELNGHLEIRWFETAPNISIVGQLVLILRPKRILDEKNITEPWQMDD